MGGAVGTGLRGMSEAIDRASETPQSAAPTAPSERGPLEEAGKSALDAESAGGRNVPNLATESGAAAGTSQAAQTASAEETLSDNPAVQQFAEAVASDSLTGKTIRLFAPEAENQDNRAAFEQAYGVELPDTVAATRRMLRDIAARKNTAVPAKAEAPAVDAAEAPEKMPGTFRETMDAPAADSESREAPLGLDAETAGPQETVENRPGRSSMTDTADETANVNAPLRETVGLKEQAPMSRKQAEVRRALESWKVTDKAADTISKNMPENVDTEVYAAAASPLYRLGRAGAESFEQALELAGSTSGTAGDINYIMSTDSGKTALKIAYLQGKGEAMRYAEEMTKLGGELSDRSTGGSGQVLYKGTMRDTTSAESRVIALNAAATGTDAVLKDVLQNDRNVKAYIDTEIGKIYFGDSADDVFGTVLHEDWHWYNALDAEGAKTLQEHVLEYLAKNSGYESIDELIRSKVKDYGAQGLTYEQAAEELVADAWRGIFDSEESFKRWVEFQRGQSEKNAGKAGTIRRVMEKVRQMLDDLISRAKEVLSADPDNRAAQKAKRLAEAEKRTLQDEYFAHAEKAMDTLRTAKENAAALKTESAAEKQGVRYSLPDMAKESEAEKTKRQMALTIRPAQMNAERTARVNLMEWNGKDTQDARKALQEVLKEFGIIGKSYTEKNLKIEYQYRTKTVRESANKQTKLTGREYGDLALVHANIEEVLENAVPLEAHADKKGKPHVEGMIVLASALRDGERVIPVRAELKLYDNKPTALYFAMAESTAEESRNAANKKEPDRKVRQEPLLTQEAAFPGSNEETGSQMEESIQEDTRQPSTGSSGLTITEFYQLVKADPDFTKYFSDDVVRKAEGLDRMHEEEAELRQQQRSLKEERAAWLESPEVKQIEARKKALGIFSAEARAYKTSEEYQGYLAKRKEYNSRSAELEERAAALDEQMQDSADGRLKKREKETSSRQKNKSQKHQRGHSNETESKF